MKRKKFEQIPSDGHGGGGLSSEVPCLRGVHVQLGQIFGEGGRVGVREGTFRVRSNVLWIIVSWELPCGYE